MRLLGTNKHNEVIQYETEYSEYNVRVSHSNMRKQHTHILSSSPPQYSLWLSDGKDEHMQSPLRFKTPILKLSPVEVDIVR